MKTYRENGRLIIALEEENLISGATGYLGAKLTDREKFLNYIADNLIDKGTNENELLNQLLDETIEEAIINEKGVICIEDSE